MSDYEAERAANIEANRALLASLGIARPLSPPKPSPALKKNHAPLKNKKRGPPPTPQEPSRKSARVAAAASIVFGTAASGDSDDANDAGERPSVSRLIGTVPGPRQLPAPAAPPPYEDAEGYNPLPIAPRPTREDAVGAGGFGAWVFEDGYEGFRPNLSPEEVLRMGSFGGTYWRAFYSRVRGEEIPEGHTEWPEEWWSDLDVSKLLTSQEYDPRVNKYGVKASQSIEEWEKAGWVQGQDPRGWMQQWYFRFWLGRRSADDARQIGRWQKSVGPRGRFKTSLIKKVRAAGTEDAWRDDDIERILKQTMQHWAVILTKRDFDAYYS